MPASRKRRLWAYNSQLIPPTQSLHIDLIHVFIRVVHIIDYRIAPNSSFIICIQDTCTALPNMIEFQTASHVLPPLIFLRWRAREGMTQVETALSEGCGFTRLEEKGKAQS